MDNSQCKITKIESADIDIIIPCYNPVNNWHKDVLNNYKSISSELPKKSIQFILINDGSSKNRVRNDDINYLKRNIPFLNYIELTENMGKGNAIRIGADASTASIMLFSDVDFPYSINNILEIIDLIENNEADIVTCRRNKEYYTKISKGRERISKLLKSLIRVIMKLSVSDTQAGLKGFSVKGKQLILKTTINRYLFDIELLKLANGKVRIKEIKAEIKDGIILPSMKYSVLFKELGNFFKILFN